MVGKRNLTVFESSSISETRMATPIKIGVHAQYIDLYLHDFLESSRFQMIKFLMTMDYSPWSEREIWPFFKVAISPKPEWRHPSKLVCMLNTLTSTCMIFLSQFQMIKFFDDHGL